MKFTDEELALIRMSELQRQIVPDMVADTVRQSPIIIYYTIPQTVVPLNRRRKP